jgi:hypothetical protein
MMRLHSHPLRSAALVLVLGALITGCSGSAILENEGDAPGASPSEEDKRTRFQVQLFISDEKGEADRALSRALDWWEGLQEPRRDLRIPPADQDASPVRIVWKAPFYRVRVGTFASREDAETIVTAAGDTFPDAFVVPVGPPPEPPATSRNE